MNIIVSLLLTDWTAKNLLDKQLRFKSNKVFYTFWENRKEGGKFQSVCAVGTGLLMVQGSF